MCEKDLLMLYRNYLFSLQEREEYGEQYGDTKEIIEEYEKKLKLVKKCKILGNNTSNRKNQNN